MFSTTGSLVTEATVFFGHTTGCSQNVLNTYDARAGGDPRLLDLPLTPGNVCFIVNKENLSAKAPCRTLADRAARYATPFRRFIAHAAAQLLVISNEGFLSKNAYSRAAVQGLLSQFG